MISTPGPLELLVILGLALLVLGPNRLPDAARSAGKAYRDFRAALSDEDEDEDEFASGDEYDLAEAGPAAEAEYREEVAGDDDTAAELADAGPAGEAGYREKVTGADEAGDEPAGSVDAGDEPAGAATQRTRGTGTEAGDPAPPPIS
jgi:sec-independent protein translocase protein TatA